MHLLARLDEQGMSVHSADPLGPNPTFNNGIHKRILHYSLTSSIQLLTSSRLFHSLVRPAARPNAVIERHRGQ